MSEPRIIRTDDTVSVRVENTQYGFSDYIESNQAIVFRAMCDEIELLRSKNTSLTNLLNDPQHCEICCKKESEQP